MSARREHRLRNLERRVAELETIEPMLRCSSTPRETAERTTFWKPCGARRKPTPTPTSG